MNREKENAVKKELPRLLYWGDVDPAPTGAGAILLWRLLDAYPPERLMICSPGAESRCPLEIVKKSPPAFPFIRLIYTRFGKIWMSLWTLLQLFQTWKKRGQPPEWLRAPVDKFQPEAVLTIGVAAAWMGAAALARVRNLPLHLIVHDEGHYDFFWIQPLRKLGTALFGRVYRQANTRFCISEPMAEDYKSRFGAEGEVLFPMRGKNALTFQAPRTNSQNPNKEKKVFYAGSIYGQGFVELEALAASLHARKIKLIVYTPSQPSGIRLRYLDVRRPLPSDELVKSLHKEADVLLLWTAFVKDARQAVRTLFPSKMVDYTATALPIVAVAPGDACISGYLRKYPDAGHLICNSAPEKVAGEIQRLLAQPEKLQQLGKGSAKAAERDFSFQKNFTVFCEAILRPSAK